MVIFMFVSKAQNGHNGLLMGSLLNPAALKFLKNFFFVCLLLPVLVWLFAPTDEEVQKKNDPAPGKKVFSQDDTFT